MFPSRLFFCLLVAEKLCSMFLSWVSFIMKQLTQHWIFQACSQLWRLHSDSKWHLSGFLAFLEPSDMFYLGSRTWDEDNISPHPTLMRKLVSSKWGFWCNCFPSVIHYALVTLHLESHQLLPTFHHEIGWFYFLQVSLLHHPLLCGCDIFFFYHVWFFKPYHFFMVKRYLV